MNQMLLVPCPRCSTQVHVSSQAPMAYCPRCMSPVSAASSNPTPPNGSWPVPGVVRPVVKIRTPGGGAGVKVGVFGAVAAAIGFTIFKVVLHGAIPGMGHGTAPDKVALADVGIEDKAADPDKMIANVRARAKSWKQDAEFYSVNVNGLRADGTVDLTKDSSVVTVEYFSPSAAGSNNPNDRKNAIKKFVFNGYGMSDELWGVRERVDHVPATPVPHCSAKQIGATLAQKGLAPGKTAQLTLDPQFAFATQKLSYSVNMSDPHLQVWFDIDSCTVIKELK